MGIVNKCERCIHCTTPKGHTCYTMLRLLNEYIGNKPWIPTNVIPGLRYVSEKCKRYKEKDEEDCYGRV